MGKGNKNAGDAGNAVEVVAAIPDRSQDPRTPTAPPGTNAMGSSRVTGADQCQTQLISLIERYCQLGRLLPAVDNIDTDDIEAIAEARLILREMSQTKFAMDELFKQLV